MLYMNLESWLPMSINGTYVAIFAGITVLYMLFRPFIHWIIATNAVKLLGYLLTSLVMLTLLLAGIVMTSVFQVVILKDVLHTLAVFGGCLVLLHVIQTIWRHKKKRV